MRVAKVNNPGNLRGLTAVRPGSTIWLMMYYTVNSLPKKMTRITTYIITYRGRIMFQAVYRGPIKPTETGRRSRYTVYTVPRSASYGSYRFKAKLAIGKRVQAKTWKFAVGKQERETAAVTS